jgi:predicted RNase H-like nuclease (RuvC/YqgF family)
MMETQEEYEVQGEVPDVEDVPRETPPEISQETIDRARMMGWRPKEEFPGDPDKFTPADKWVERGENMIPIMKSQMGKYENKISSLEAQIESQKKTTERLLKMSETVQQRENRFRRLQTGMSINGRN